MKDRLENIDEIFKQSFDGFESSVDPSVWNNIQNSIGVGSTPQLDPSSATGIAGKSLTVKIIAASVLVSTIATATYFIPNLFKDKKTVVTENVVATDNLTETTEDNEILGAKIDVEKRNNAIENTVVEAEESVEESNQNAEVTETNNKNSANTDVTTNESNDDASPSEESTPPLANNNPKTSEKLVTTSKNDGDLPKNNQTTIGVKINTNVISGKAPLNVEFNAEGDNIVSYLWDFDDKTEISNEQNPYHTFDTPGTYTISLMVMDKLANSTIIVKSITVQKNNTSFIDKKNIPRAFTPNGDGKNDILKINGEKIEEFHAVIYNLNGSKIYEWNSLEGFWDGRDMSGELVSKGIYMLKVTAIGEDGESLPTVQKAVTIY